MRLGSSIEVICKRLLCAVVAMMFHLATAQEVAGAKLTIEKPASWISPLPFQRLSENTRLDAAESTHFLLMDNQINAGENATFKHVVKQVRTHAGVKTAANLTIDFDPSYQTLVFHWVRIWRGTNSLDRLNRDKIRSVSHEPNLEQLTFLGSESASLVLNDVRIGDIIDYAYTLRGVNPVFDGKFATTIPMQWTFPVDRLFTRLIVPEQRRLYASNHLCFPHATVARRQGVLEYAWDSKKVPALHIEDSLPDWFDPIPSVQISEFPSWAAVNQWALQLFQNDAPLSPELKQKIEEWRRLGRWEDRVLAALLFVQDEIRYFGIEVGASSHKPSDATLVFERRFGDCKDKALLFVTILRALGIEAYPVLVDTDLGRKIAELPPSAQAFNHVITLVRFEGRSYWLDPTATHQPGTLANYRPPNYERGLIVSPRTTSLTTIPQANQNSRTTVSEYFQLRDKFQPADLKVVTVAEGSDAEAFRYKFANTAREDIEKKYLHFYSENYPEIRRTQPIDFHDDPERNRVEITEFYTIPNAWQKPEGELKYQCFFYPALIGSFFINPVDKERAMPLGVRYPAHFIKHTEVQLPDVFTGRREDQVISDPAFSFQKHIRCWGTRLDLDYEYEALDDFVAADRVAEFLRNQNHAFQFLGYSLSWY